MTINIKNANIVLPNEVLESSSVTIVDGKIDKIDSNSDTGTVIDAKGAYLLPGMIDIHSDHIEQAIEPRHGSLMETEFALREQEKQLINNGITTMYHSLSMWRPVISAMGRKTLREGNRLEQVIREIIAAAKAPRLITHKVHIRYDITNIAALEPLMGILKEGDISLLSFMDHTPGQGQYRNVEKARATIKAFNPNLSDDEIEKQFQERMNVEKIANAKLAEIADFAISKGISVASHDDDTIDKVNFVRNELKATISEFPVELEVARYATKVGMATLGGAANVLMGKSHSGNLSAIEGILDGSISMLCSDYYPPAMLRAVFKLHREFNMPLNECAKLVTSTPAKAVGIDNEVGSIEVGKKADLILVDASGQYTNIMNVITNGKVTAALNYS